MFQAPTHLGNARRLLDRVSSTIYRSPYCPKVLNADGRVNTVCAFFTFFPPTSFTTISICASLFSPSFRSFPFFQRTTIPNFLRTSFIALNFILLRASLDATISLLFQFSFVSILAQPQASYNSYTSLLPQSSSSHAYFVYFGMVSSSRHL